ncbi:hypothetical protein Q4511_06010 [Paracoccus sp. 1_MG-2023]|uniref:hypothetical protein n=1 Tax=unclassified Paracoccus (in: a-proteobacteria) TaxID=2688777 RepID=UPI001C094E58|nr:MULTISPECIES: hypothetical protein [unclassified Paracoccus (in: a-proteobacteria)]MBU2958543.1 hypothetical protein [Paracoccus sp. C2R09]MDO6668472.1 hypothetical protein [Paracoccus sp. 1_MG-2023]
MTDRPLIFHIGVQKTGTTSVQRFLEQAAPRIADRVIIRTPEEGTPMRPLGRAAVAYSLAPGKDLREALVAALDDVLDTIPEGHQPVLISHENLAGAMPGNGGETGLYPVLPRLLKQLDKVAQGRGFRPCYVFSSRAMDDWLPSVWAQAVRTDGYDGSWDDFRAATADLPDWPNLQRRIANAVGEDRVTRLQVEECPDIARRLLTIAGLPQHVVDALPDLEVRAMERLNPNATEFLRQLNRLDLNPHARDRVAELVARKQHLFTADAPSEGTL